jgi:anti-anti-sigma factor
MTLQEDTSVAHLAPDLCVSSGTAIVTLAGEFDLARAEELRECLVQPEVLSARVVRVDLSRVSFLDSVIIGLLVSVCKKVRKAGSSFSVVCDIEGIARSVFEIDGLLEYLEVEEPSAGPRLACLGVIKGSLECGSPNTAQSKVRG